jgi:hypothetical protein
MTTEKSASLTADIHETGLVCPVCKQPVAMIVNILKGMLVMQCQACGTRWSGKPKH